LHTIDLVLITHMDSMLGLPYLTEYLGYKGKIIATEPTIEFAKQRMEELIIYHGPTISRIDPGSYTYNSQLMSTSSIPEGWRSIYTIKDVESCVEKIQPVRFNEQLFLFSTLSLVAHSSGHSLGSANWALETSFKKVVFLSTSCLYPNLHPAPFDHQVLLNADAVITSNVVEPSSDHVSFERSRGKLLAHIGRSIQSNQNVLIASPSMNISFDLIGDIESYFKAIGAREIGADNDQIPIYVANPVANQSLQYANICGEWMNLDRQCLLYEPETPLAHGNLMRKGALETIESIDSRLEAKKIREPCIVFAGEPKFMQKGALPWFLEYWKKTKSACIMILPESKLPTDSIPKESEMNFIRIPLETRLKLEDVPSILRTTERLENTRHLLIPKMKGADLVKEDLSGHPNTEVYIYQVGDIINIDLERDWEKVTVSEKLAKSIRPVQQENSDGHVSIYAPISGTLHFYNNKYELEPNTTPGRGQPEIKIELNTIIKRFEQHSIPIQITEDEQGTIILELPLDMNSRVLLNHDSIVIISDNQNT
ncbi:Integrator complex subunit 9, partial [Rhizopus stolonifer]